MMYAPREYERSIIEKLLFLHLPFAVAFLTYHDLFWRFESFIPLDETGICLEHMACNCPKIFSLDLESDFMFYNAFSLHYNEWPAPS